MLTVLLLLSVSALLLSLESELSELGGDEGNGGDRGDGGDRGEGAGKDKGDDVGSAIDEDEASEGDEGSNSDDCCGFAWEDEEDLNEDSGCSPSRTCSLTDSPS